MLINGKHDPQSIVRVDRFLNRLPECIEVKIAIKSYRHAHIIERKIRMTHLVHPYPELIRGQGLPLNTAIIRVNKRFNFVHFSDQTN